MVHSIILSNIFEKRYKASSWVSMSFKLRSYTKATKTFTVNTEMGNLVLFLVLAKAILGVNPNTFDPNYCYSDDNFRPQKEIMGVFTPYNFVRGQNINSTVSSCTPSRFWLFARHGMRSKSIDNLRDS